MDLKVLYDKRIIGDWKFYSGDVTGVEKEGFDDSSWQVVNVGYCWDSSKSASWFRKLIEIPEKIEGIDIRNSKVEIRFFTIPGGEFFVNGERKYRNDYWLDANCVFTEKAKPGDKFLIAAKLRKGDGLGSFGCNLLFIESIENRIFELEYSLNSSKLHNKHKKMKVHLIGHAHIDMNWLWTWEDTLDTCKRTFETVDKLMDEYPDFKFSQSQAAIYHAVENNFPELFERIKKRVKEGKWDITASTWVEGDTNMASGESLVRQTLYAKKYIKEKFGVEPRVCWCPDTFGHAWTYPQILKKSGIDFYYGHRCSPGYPEFWWQSPDGSKILVFNHAKTYNAEITPCIVDWVVEAKEKVDVNNYLVVYGVGDHGGGPTRRDLNKAKKLQARKDFPELKFDKAENFYKEVLKQGKKLPSINDELNFVFEGCYTTHGDIKLMNRKIENLLPAAEIFSSIANVAIGLAYPDKNFEEAWRRACFNQFHDILDGSAIHSSYEYSRKIFEEAEKIGKESLDKAVSSIASKIEYTQKGIPVVVFNQLNWDRVDLVEVDITKSGKNLGVKDNKGNYVPSQVNGNILKFTAKVPSIGYRTYYLKPERGLSPNGDCPRERKRGLSLLVNDTEHTIENEFFVVKVNKVSGCLGSIFDKRNNKEVFALLSGGSEGRPPFIHGNMLQVLYEMPHGMSAWNIGTISRIENLVKDAKVEVMEEGSVSVTVRVTHKFNNSVIKQGIVIYRDIPRIDFKTEVDWQEKGGPDVDSPMLKAVFPLDVCSDKASYEIPYGYIERKVNGREVPALKWVDISEGGYGVSLLNDCKYGYEVCGNTIKMTLVRSAYEPDLLPDVGINRFAYSLYPHKGDWKKADTVRRGYEFNNPFIVKVGVRQQSAAESIPDEQSFLEIEPSNLILSALKKSETGKSLIMRIYESQCKAVAGKIRFNFPVKYVRETDLMENPTGKKIKVKNNTLKIRFNKSEIKTFSIM